MKTLIVFIALFLISACGHQENEYQSYLRDFVARAGQSGNLFFTVAFTEVDYAENPDQIETQNLALGCHRTPGIRTITVEKNLWTALSPQRREQGMFHVLAHCLLNRVHPDDVNTVVRPDNVMDLTPFTDDEWDAQREELLKKLF